MLDCPLSKEAYENKSWWTKKDNPFACEWKNAGYTVLKVNLGNNVTFQNIEKQLRILYKMKKQLSEIDNSDPFEMLEIINNKIKEFEGKQWRKK